MLVNVPPTQAVLVVHAGDNPGIIINRDIINPVLLGNNPGIILPYSANVLDALTFIQYSGNDDVWAQASGGSVVQIDVQAENQNWSPSPAQSAASLSALGIPLLTKSTNIINQQNQVLAAAGSTTFGPVSIGQIGYHVFVTAKENSPGTQHLTVQVDVIWSDSGTGLTVAQDTFYFLPGASVSGTHNVIGDGPSKGDTVTVRITNNDTAPITYSFALNQNSRPYSTDTWRTLGAGMPAFTGFTSGAYDIAGLILLDMAPSPSAGQTVTRPMGYYTGPVNLLFDVRGAITGNATLNIIHEDPRGQNLSEVFSTVVAGGNRVYQLVALPNAQCYATFTNQGTASGLIGLEIIAVEKA